MSCVVDTEADSVRCFPGTSAPKTIRGESGTSISLLVPVRITMGETRMGRTEGQDFVPLANNFLSLFSLMPITGWYHSHLGMATIGGILCTISIELGS